MAAASDDSYDRYVRAEWALAANDPRRAAAARDAVAGLAIRRVLDIGCGAGQELRPFLTNPSSLGVGIDLSFEVGIAGRELFAAEAPLARVTFVRAGAEELPFGSATFDVIVCRLALPYTDNACAIGEIARVLRRDGVVLLKFHHARYYLDKFKDGLATGQITSAIHACRVLFAGCIYHLTGVQPRGRVTGRETFQSLWLLRRELHRHGLEVRRTLSDSVPAAPNLLIRRAGSSASRDPLVVSS